MHQMCSACGEINAYKILVENSLEMEM